MVPSRDRNAAGRNDLAAAQQPPSGFGTYTYDASGNITSIGDATAKDSFLYDELGRQLPEGPAQTFTYDRYGNILTVTTAGDAIVKKLGANANTNQLTRAANDYCQPNNVFATYDSRGNLISCDFGTFVYGATRYVKNGLAYGRVTQ